MKTYWRSWYFQTAKRARMQGVPVSRHYGYVVRVHPAPPPGYEGRRPGCESLESWCDTKSRAMQTISDNMRFLEMGCFECPCGSERQARGCCGVPPKGDFTPFKEA